MNTSHPVVTVKGLEPESVRLELAYPNRSWQELILTNNGKHHIIAAVLLYEFTTADDKRALARDVILDPSVSLETNPTTIKQILGKHPVIPPSSRWLIGVGVDRTRIIGSLPPYEETRSLVALLLPIPGPLKTVNITIDGAILEDGQIVGPQKENTKQWVSDMVIKQKEGTP